MEFSLLTVEELDDVREVHVVVDDDLTVNGDQSQGQKEDKVPRGNPGGHPDHLPDGEDVLVQELWAGPTEPHQPSCLSTTRACGSRRSLHLS